MTINLPSIFQRNYRPRSLEIGFQDIKVSKFSEGASLHTPLLKYRFGEVLWLDSLLNAEIGLGKALKSKIFLGEACYQSLQVEVD